MGRYAVTIIFLSVAVSMLTGCDKIPGLGGEQQQQVAPIAPAPVGQAQPGMQQPAAGIPNAAPAALPPTPATPPTPPPPTGDPLTDKLNAKKFELAADWTPTSAMLKQPIDEGKEMSFQVQLPGPPYCHTFIAVGPDDIKNLDMSIVSPMGATEGNDNTAESLAVVQNHCPQSPGPYKLTVKAAQGAGEFAVQVYSKSK